MKISIAMATYNGAQFIQAQLQSFVCQTRHPDELIITDDCSKDQTEAIVREFAKTAPFIVKFYRNEKNLGYCGNFNAALMKTTGDLVFLSDQDDVWFPEKIEHMIGVAERNPQALVVMNDAALTDGQLNEVGLTKIGQIRSAGLSHKDFVMGCCSAIRRELLNIALPIPEGFTAHDGWFMWFADGLGKKKIEDRVLQLYRRHEANESHFIANRTRRVSKFSILFHSMKRFASGDVRKSERVKFQQFKIFCSGVDRALTNSSSAQKEDLRALLEQTQYKIKILHHRSLNREKPFFIRAFSTFQLLMRVGFRNLGGIKAILSDLVG